MTFAHYLNHMALLTDQWTATNYKDPERQRMYMKDIDCPQLWHNKLQTILPPFLYYLNETTGDLGGFGSTDEPDPSGTGFRRGKGIAKAGDLMSCLPQEMRAENMMCYIGHEGTYTPSHREMCASLGQNIMVEASTGLAEDGKLTKPGSSLWFMTENKEREVVAEYWLSRLGHDIEVENHFAQINAWKNAPFKTYVVEQRPGDLILIPPLAPHQVWNRGTRTMKVAWNRTTIETLEMALNEALPKARMVCRDEQYKNKAIIYFALQKYSKLLKSAEKHKQHRSGSKSKSKNDTKVRQLEKDFRRLHGLYTQLLVSESFLPEQQEKCEMVPYEGFVTCSYCRCNIFNRFLTCSTCVIKGGDVADTYDICLECYAMGRSCACISRLKWAEQFPWPELTQRHEAWRHQILAYEGKVTDKSPMSLKVELQRVGRKRTLAQICQLELKRRPWRDIKKPPPQLQGVEHEEEVRVDENGNLKKKKKVRRSEKFMREHALCHIDKYWEPKWKQAACSTCDKHYCYGTLFRAYDMMPQDILADPDWTCPSCRGICSCRSCRKKPGYKPYTPSGTRLGHNTRAVADTRSVESLVDFSYSNIGWIQKAGDDTTENTRRLNKRRMEADAAQAQDTELGEDYVDDEAERDPVEDGILRLAQREGIPVDPALAAMNAPTGSPGSMEEPEDMYDENPEARHETDLSNTVMAPQFVIPEGGILRDLEHAYDFTDAITYDYPDPSMMVPAPITADEPEPQTGAVEPDDDHIEMVARKRKRNKLDEGERAFTYRKALPKKKKKQQSLIVKLPINKQRLAEVNKGAITERALNGTQPVPAPVIGSDLQALNTSYPNVEGQPLPKKARTEHIEVERDDEYAPSRRRDRRKAGPDGVRPPPRDDDVTRRTTRMQAMTYEEHSDEEDFDEVLEPKAAPSKLATMENAVDIDDLDSEGERTQDGPATVEQPTVSDKATEVDAMDEDESHDGPEADTNGEARPAASSHPVAKIRPITSQNRASPVVSRPSTANSVQVASRTDTPNKKALAQASANRQAKMAALHWAEGDSDTGSIDDWSDEERDKRSNSDHSQTTAESVPVSAASPAVASTAVNTPPAVPKITAPSRAPAADARSSSSAPRAADLMVVKPASSAPPIAAPSMMPEKSKLTVTADDWSESDSDASDIPPLPKAVPKTAPSSGWVSVNGSGSRGITGGSTRGRGGGTKRGRARGRPAVRRG